MTRFASLLVVTLLLFSACSADKSVLGHRVAFAGAIKQDLAPELVTVRGKSGAAVTVRTFAALREDYESASTDEKRRHYRNLIIRRLMLLDDEYFLVWSQKLYGGRTIARTVSDIALGMLTAGAAATNPAKMAETLSLMATGIATTQVAFEKNLFLEQSAGALIAKMEQDRARVDTQITQYLRDSSDTDYPLDQGLRDFLRYYRAGTLANASDGLKADATVARDEAQAQVEGSKGDTIISPGVLAKANVAPPQISTRKSAAKAEGPLETDRLSEAVLEARERVRKWVEAREAENQFTSIRGFLIANAVSVENLTDTEMSLKARMVIRKVKTPMEADRLELSIHAPPKTEDPGEVKGPSQSKKKQVPETPNPLFRSDPAPPAATPAPAASPAPATPAPKAPAGSAPQKSNPKPVPAYSPGFPSPAR
ncbi:MAG: hypothetical protein QOE70_4252 [Chthoniobacter sp.]|jgi:hypothetical protein|nr:hypothetical protein [Chthoniobacter sp.]